MDWTGSRPVSAKRLVATLRGRLCLLCPLLLVVVGCQVSFSYGTSSTKPQSSKPATQARAGESKAKAGSDGGHRPTQAAVPSAVAKAPPSEAAEAQRKPARGLPARPAPHAGAKGPSKAPHEQTAAPKAPGGKKPGAKEGTPAVAGLGGEPPQGGPAGTSPAGPKPGSAGASTGGGEDDAKNICDELSARLSEMRGLIAASAGEAPMCVAGQSRLVRATGAPVFVARRSVRDASKVNALASGVGPQPRVLSKTAKPTGTARSRVRTAEVHKGRPAPASSPVKPLAGVRRILPASLSGPVAQKSSPPEPIKVDASRVAELKRIEATLAARRPKLESKLALATLAPSAVKARVGLIALHDYVSQLPDGPKFPVILGGKSCKDYPATGAVLFRGSLHCTGTLIAPKVVLTAAHCLCGFSVDELSFTTVPTLFGDLTAGFAVPVSSAIAHERYDPVTVEHDLALLYLETAPEGVEPALRRRSPLPASPSQVLHFAGYGFTDPEKTIDGEKHCVDMQPEAGCGAVFYYAVPGKQTCNGDSGGPAYLDVNGKPMLAGLTSWGDPDCSSYGVDVDVGYYATWIDKHLKEPR